MMQHTWYLHRSTAYVPDPLLFSVSVNAQDCIALGKCLVKEKTCQQKFKLGGYQYIIHCEHEPQNIPFPSGYLCFTSPSSMTSGIKHRKSSPRAPLPFFSKTVPICLHRRTLSQVRPRSTTNHQPASEPYRFGCHLLPLRAAPEAKHKDAR